ncbi:MAG: VIT domain-containing protein [Blastocatellia bacterium]
MKFRVQPCRIFAALLVMLFVSVLVQGQGIILPRPCERPIPRCPQPTQIPQQPLKVKSIKFTTKITDQVAVTYVEQVFENDSPFVLEGVYFFPLPDNVSITEFAMWDGNKRLVGEVRSRDEARKIYDNIVRSRRDPALLEYAGKNLFQASIFPIQPNSDKKIELKYSQILTAESGMVGYRYPLGTGWKANGFMPTVRPMDGERQTPQPRQAPGSISASVEIDSNVPIKGVYSPSHEISVKRDGERRAKLSFEARSAGAQPDFQLFYNLSEQDFGVSLLTYREPGKDGYFLLLVSPKAQLDEQNVVSKDVIFVMDTSGSMSGDKILKAKAALRFGVNTLDARDRFNIVSFSGEEHLLSVTPLNGDNAGKRQALEFIDRMNASGGTNINDSLQAAFRLVQPSERARMIVLVTDGQPTVGETNAKRIMENVRQANTSHIRLFTFGVGYDVNTVLLDGLANDNGGAVAYVEPNEDLEVKVSNFFAKINHPVLSGVSIDWAGLPTDMIYPRVMPDLFHGSQLVMVGRYRDDAKDHRISLLGNVNGQGRNFVYEDLAFPEKQSKNDFLPHLWAMRRVGYLLDQIRSNGESKELRDEVVQLGTRYGIVTPYTSYLVLEPGMNVSDRTVVRSQTVQVNGQDRSSRPPAKTNSPNAVLTPSLALPPPPPLGAAGQEAVKTSKQKEELKKADVIADSANLPNQNTMRKASGKLFYLRDGVWTDSEFKAEDKLPVVALKFASNEYFDLVGKESKLADCFALGQSVIVVWSGKVYKVEP